MAATMKCPHCTEEINLQASKCPYCGGGIKKGDGSGFLVNVLGAGLLGFIGGWVFGGNGISDGFAWGLIGICAGPFLWIYNAFMKPTKK